MEGMGLHGRLVSFRIVSWWSGQLEMWALRLDGFTWMLKQYSGLIG
jgi:hypothetical protein